MTDIETMIEKYVASWNNPDAGARRQVIDEIWAADGVYRNATSEFAGRAGIEDAVSEAYAAFGSNGYMFRVARLDQNHNAVRYRWEMIPTTGGEPDSIGTHIAMLGPDGCLLSDHQFIDKPPSAG